MKKLFLFYSLGITALTVGAQNIQIHYDLGKHIYNTDEHNRQDVTLTYEGFKADGTGSWYYFIDTDFSKNGMIGAYTEISREFTLARLGESSSLAAHGEINAGVSRGAGIFQPAFLVGATWNWHSADFYKTFSLQLMYKQFTGQNFNVKTDSDLGATVRPYWSCQLTGVWGLNFCNRKLTFSGFIDFWRGMKNKTDGTRGGCLVILTEPQLWYNISQHCSVGTECELSNNFIFNCVDYNNNKFYVNPTIAFKYNF